MTSSDRRVGRFSNPLDRTDPERGSDMHGAAADWAGRCCCGYRPSGGSRCVLVVRGGRPLPAVVVLVSGAHAV